MAGAAATPSAVATRSASASSVAVRSASSLVAESPRRFLYSASKGTKACEKAPSANSRRSRLGMRKATKNASVAAPAPNSLAITTSRTNPRTRDTSVMLLTVASAFSRFMRELQLSPAENLAPACATDYNCALSFRDGHGEYEGRAQGGPSIRNAAQAQREPALGAGERDQERHPGDPGRRQSRRRKEASADVPALRDPRALRHAAGDDAADTGAACDRPAGEDPRSLELRGSRLAGRQVSRFSYRSRFSRNPELSGSSSGLAW